MPLVITIARENGSGGREIGRRVAKELGIDFYDNNLLDLTAQRTHFDVQYMQKRDEKAPGLWAAFALGGPIGQISSASAPDYVFQEESETIRQVAEKADCVIVGRASDYVLRDCDNVINVFVYAPIDYRVQRKMALLPPEQYVSPRTMKKQLEEADNVRSKFYSYYTGLDWEPGNRFQLNIDTSRIGVDGAVATILAYVRAWKAQHPLSEI